jgi:hydroxyacyl-ACP dehydratase HTD2-like protein with hotdog domain
VTGRDDLDAAVAGWDPPPVLVEDVIGTRPAEAMAALLDRAPPPSSELLPPLWHWSYFLDWPPAAELGPDGHPLRGSFLPPVPGRTRMFVGGHLRVHAGLRFDVAASRSSAVVASSVKTGRSGDMLFVTLRHRVEQEGRLALVDEQQLMYRSGRPARRPDPPGDPAPAAPDRDAPWQEELAADPVTLFRFSALTANSHRIHYDRPYATGVEGYPELVVHGPLLAVLMAGLARRYAPDRRVAAMRYSFERPVFAGEPVVLTGRPDAAGATLAVVAADGRPRAHADITFA